MSHADLFVDAFVAAVNHGYREPRPAHWVPAALRGPELDGLFEWRIVALEHAPWVDELEQALDCPLPPTLRSLIARYQFPCFDLGPLALYANTEAGTTHELRQAVLDGSPRESCLLAAGLLQVGRPVDWHPDLICCDLAAPLGNGECRLVRVDASALDRGEARRLGEIAPSLAHLLGKLVI